MIRIRLNSRLVPVLVAVLIILQIVVPYDGWNVLLVGLGGAFLVGCLWSYAASRSLSMQREHRFGWAQVGDRLEERFTLVNHGQIPGLWVEIIDQSSLPGYCASQVTGISANSRTWWRTEGTCCRRGEFTLGPTLLRSGDPFGIFSFEIRDPHALTLLVTPPIIPLPFIQVLPSGRGGDGQPRRHALERTISASTVRSYVPGDSLRTIHWRTSAHRGELYVRLFDGSPAERWWVILDLESRVQAGQGQDSTEEHGVILAASLVDLGLQMRHPVGLAASGRELVWLPPRQGEGQRLDALQSLALVSTGEIPLDEMLQRMKTAFGRQASLIIITASPEPAWLEALISLRRVGISLTVLLLDPQSYGGTASILPAQQSLAGLGVKFQVIPHSLLDRPEAHPGDAGRWDWRVTPTGRAIPVQQPRDLTWRTLS